MKRLFCKSIIIIIMIMSGCSKEQPAQAPTGQPERMPEVITPATEEYKIDTPDSEVSGDPKLMPENTTKDPLPRRDSTDSDLVSHLQREYEVAEVTINETQCFLKIDASYSTYDELTSSIRTLSGALKSHDNAKWQRVDIIFKGIHVVFAEESDWENWEYSYDGPDMKRLLLDYADVTITDITIDAKTFWGDKNANVTPLEGLHNVQKLFDISESTNGTAGIIGIAYDGMKRKDYQNVYLYSVRLYSSSAGREVSQTLLDNLVVYPETGKVTDFLYKRGVFEMKSTLPEIRKMIIDEATFPENYRVNSEYSIIMTLEDYEYEKMLEIVAFEDGDTSKAKPFVVHISKQDGFWLTQSILAAGDTEIISKESLQRSRVLNGSTSAHEYELDSLTAAEKDFIVKVDKALDTNRIYFLPHDGSVKYDIDRDGKIEEITLKTIQHYNALNMAGSQEFELRCGDDIIYYLINGDSDNYSDMCSVGSIGLCDADRSDDNYELLITLSPYNGIYQQTTLYQWEGERIVKFEDLHEEVLAVSGEGKVYYWGGNLIETYGDHFNPDYVLSYYDMKRKKFVPTTQIIGKTLTSMEGIIIFDSEKHVPVGAPVEVTLDLPGVIRQIRKGEEITILSTGDDTAKIQTEDGLTGWIGGFHMVWD